MYSDTSPWRSLLVVLACMASVAAAPPASQPAGITGVLLGVDGKPLGAADVWLVTAHLDLSKWMGLRLDRAYSQNDDRRVVATSADGRFAFDGFPGNFALIVWTDGGGALVKRSDLADHGRGPVTLRVQPWATIHGTVTFGGQPVHTDVAIAGYDFDNRLQDEIGPYIRFEATSDATGHFAVDHLFPGSYALGGKAMVIAASGTPTEAAVTVGRTVRGRFTAPAAAGTGWNAGSVELSDPICLPTVQVPGDLARHTPAEWKAWYDRWSASPGGQLWAAAQKASRDHSAYEAYRSMPDGSFEIGDVPDGTFDLTVRYYARNASGGVGYYKPLAAATYRAIVPPGQPGVVPGALDVGTLVPSPTATLLAGQPVPDIAFQTADGVGHQLSQYRGKVVLLDFWGAWCGQCVAQLPKVKAIVDAHRADPDFVAISLDVRDTPDKWRAAVAAHGMDWAQARLGTTAEAWQAKLLGVTGYPSLWLIGRDGRVVAHDWETESVRPYVDIALARPATTGPAR